MNSPTPSLLDRLAGMLPDLASDTSPMGRDFYETALAYIRLVERFEKVMGIADKYDEDLRETTAELRISHNEIERQHEELKIISAGIQEREEELRRSEEKYRLLAENATDVIWTMNLDGACTYVSPSVFQLRGYTPEEVMHQTLEEAFCPGSIGVIRQQIQEALSSGAGIRDGGPGPVQAEQPCRDGSTVWTEVVTRLYFNDKGEPVGFICASRDISDRRVIECDLKETEKTFHLFTENSPDVFFLWNLATEEAIYISPSITRVTGFTVEEISHYLVQGMTPQTLEYYLPRHLERTKIFLTNTSVELDFIDELEYYRKDGSTYPAEVSQHYMLDMHGNPIGVGVLRDTTERKKVERALREKEEHLINVFEHAPIGIFHSFLGGKFLAANPALVKMLGYSSAEELISKTADMSTQIYVDPEERPRIMQALLATDGWVHYDEVLWRRKDGEIISVDMTGRKVHNISGELAYLEGFIIDITERKKAELALLESESFNRGLVENLPDYIIVYGYDRNIRYVNPALATALGYHPGEMEGESILSFIAQEHRHVVGKIKAARLDGVEPAVYETDLITRDHSRRSVIVKGTPIQYMNTQAILLLLIDITERKHFEEALKENEEKFFSIFEETPDPILILDSSYQILDVNRGFEQVFECTHSDATEKNLDDLNIDLTRESVIQLLENAGNERHVLHREMNLVKLTGVPFVAEVAISRITIRNEPCLLIQIHDIDEIRRAHEAVSQVNEKLKILSSITRHDILNRIMVASSYGAIIREDVTDAKTRERLDAIIRVSGEIQNLIQFTAQYQDMGVSAPLWQNIATIIRYRTIQGLVPGIEIQAGASFPEIYADQMLEKVVYNLVENSARYGQNLTDIRFSSHEDGGDMIIWYEDNGGGIAAEEKELVFRKGYGKNTGLGLFLIREILSITGITIREIGEPGVGVRFEIRIPAGKWRKAGV